MKYILILHLFGTIDVNVLEVALIKGQFVQNAEANFGNDLSIEHLRSNPLNHGTPN